MARIDVHLFWIVARRSPCSRFACAENSVSRGCPLLVLVLKWRIDVSQVTATDYRTEINFFIAIIRQVNQYVRNVHSTRLPSQSQASCL